MLDGHLGPHARIVCAALYVEHAHGSVLALRHVELLERAHHGVLLPVHDYPTTSSQILRPLLHAVSLLAGLQLTRSVDGVEDLLRVFLAVAVGLTASVLQLKVTLRPRLQLEHLIEDPVGVIPLLLLSQQRRSRSLLHLLVEAFALVFQHSSVERRADGLVHLGR